MRDLMGISLGGMVKGNEQVFLCFDWAQNDEAGASCIKVRYGNRKFFTTLFKTKDADSIMLLRWKNDADGNSYEMKKPAISRTGDLFKLDLAKEFVAMGLESKFADEDNHKRGGGSSHFYASSTWIHVGDHGYYYAEHVNGEDSRDYLNFCFEYPGIRIGNSLIRKIEIDTFDSIRDENMEPLYEFMRTVMDEPVAVSEYQEEALVELFTKHFPITMHMDIWCQDKLLRASIDHLGIPPRWFAKHNIIDGVKKLNAETIATDVPLEFVIKELGI